jgi:hypothetical protein
MPVDQPERSAEHEDRDVRDGSQPPDVEASQEVMSLLSEHVPLALLADLAIPEGPASPDILDEEGLPEVAWWESDTAEESETSEESAPTV